MFGHGCPPSPLLRPVARGGAVWLGQAILFATFFGIACAESLWAAEPSNWHVRFSWSSDVATSFRGEILVSDGEFVSVSTLGTERDAPGSIWIRDPQTIRVAPRLPRTHDGCELVVRARPSTKVMVRLAATGRDPIRAEIPLGDLLEGNHHSSYQRGNTQLTVTRLANDTIRVTPRNQSLVFNPGEKISLDIVAAHLAIKSQTGSLHVELKNSANDELWNREEDLRFAANDESEPVDVSFAAPREPGVYELHFAVLPKRAIPLPRRSVLAKRRVELIVVDPHRKAEDIAAITLRDERVNEKPIVGEIDLANPRWWERIARLPSSKLFIGSRNGPVASGATTVVTHQEAEWLAIAPGQWQACPLPTGKTSGPLVLELSLPNETPVDLGVALVETNAAGESPSLVCERRIQIDDWQQLNDEPTRRYRIPFTSSGRGTWVLLTNRDPRRQSLIGKLVVRMGDKAAAPPIEGSERSAWLFAEQPWIARDLLAPDILDATTKRPIDDWSTWQTVAERLVEQVHRAGASGAVITLASDGGGLFPNESLAPSPRLERRPQGESADPIPKDVLELLLRTFDREGLRLVPAITFNGTLPAAEKARETASGGQTEEGRLYDPLDPAWQAAVSQTLVEIAQRYGHHPSFGGVSLNLHRDVPLCFISSEEGSTTPDGLEFHSRQREMLASDAVAHRRAWHAWRARKLSQWLASVATEMRTHAPSARLLPSLPSEVVATAAQRAEGFASTVDDQSLMAAGWFPDDSSPALRWIVPPQIGDAFDLGDTTAGESNVNESFAMGDLRSATILHDPTWETKNPFGAMKNRLFIASQPVSVGAVSRKALALSMARSDQREWFYGGGILPVGQEDELRPALVAVRSLPDVPFAAIPPEDPNQSRLAVVRTAEHDGATYICLVNAAPWPQDFSLAFSRGQSAAIERLGTGEREPLQDDGETVKWTSRLLGYEIVALRADGSASIENWSAIAGEKAADGIRQWVRDVRQRLPTIRDPRPLDVISNAGFETPALKGLPPGWASAEGSHVQVAVDTRGAHEGKQALHLTCRPGDSDPRAVAWIRSADFEPPATRRIAVTVWMRSASDREQPTVRIAFDARYNGQGYYRWANVGKSEDGAPANPLSTQWKKYVFSLENLPESGLGEMQVGFDLIGPGEIWIDQVELFDIWVNEREFDQLTRSAALAELQIERGHYDHACRFLASPWPEYLRRAGGVVKREKNAAAGTSSQQPSSGKTTRPGVLERFKGLVPRLKRADKK